MKSEPTIIYLPTGLQASQVTDELRYQFPHISRLRVSNAAAGLLISWTARRYSKDEVEQHLHKFVKQQIEA